MKSKKWQKFVGGAMAGLMSFSIVGTTLAVPAYAASYESSWSEREHREDVHKEMRRHQEKQNKIEQQRRAEQARHEEKVRQLRYEKEKHEREQYEKERRARWEREHRHQTAYDRYREAREREEAQRKHDQKVQTNRTIAAAAIGAVVGAVIAKNS
ncbi:hypothetical protein SELR_00760 [Selenomonas ruminantium subsp. lactilytica TAM6421]|uniref:Uncharacterized protein n=1 Tax=Selenomonas ruminantium subsp. lactilytica (strain NBRC 103574 / TAM6421) TaxID=927704 RepID=I0GLZ7_SELRL|nr:hypothetical protein [Selenomonas ruminantium]BAL81784.1 hypothetical protein SELR_00760 [Selenomonas ruminantium subsp. lactilytica TAM6421]